MVSRLNEIAYYSEQYMSERVFIALGSNLGDRMRNFHSALKMMREVGIAVVDTGFLYQSEPMYLLEQPRFLNSVCEVRTGMAPHELLAALKRIEDKVGRVKTVRNGPRCIDLDIVLYGSRIIETPDLIVPHPRMSERSFVLTPLSDMDGSIVHPVFNRSVVDLLSRLPGDQGCNRVVPSGLSDTVLDLSQQSLIAGILNVTPDSFSDGGEFASVETACARARVMIQEGADIIDVGGESTRPTASAVDCPEEVRRVSAVITNLRREHPELYISIDTYKAATARAAVTAGACIVNDVSAGMLDPEMLPTVASLQLPYILTHAGRIGAHSVIDFGDGNPSVLTSEMDEDEIVRIIRSQLASRVAACIEAGIARWALVLDPGLGFGKTGSVNFTILRRLKDIFSGPLGGFPVMIGASRKRFVCDLANDGSDYKCSPEEALLGTAAVTVAAASRQLSGFIHRVHDVAPIRRILSISDRIFLS